MEASSVFYLDNWGLPGVFENNPYPIAVNGSLWTLPLEFKMYILIAIFGVIGLLFRRTTVLALGIGSLFLYACMLSLNNSIAFKTYDFLNRIGIVSIFSPIIQLDTINVFYFYPILFIIGSAFYLYRDKIKFKHSIGIPLIISLIAGIFYFKPNDPILNIIIIIVLPYVVFYIAQIKCSLNNFGKYGDFSYGMYIFAFPIQQTIALKIPGLNPISFFLISFPVTFVFAFLSWHIIEKRALKYKNFEFPRLPI
jgi:peptidoglycan/LPS O-acetylase OafA/YrhL